MRIKKIKFKPWTRRDNFNQIIPNLFFKVVVQEREVIVTSSSHIKYDNKKEIDYFPLIGHYHEIASSLMLHLIHCCCLMHAQIPSPKQKK